MSKYASRVIARGDFGGLYDCGMDGRLLWVGCTIEIKHAAQSVRTVYLLKKLNTEGDCDPLIELGPLNCTTAVELRTPSL